MMATETAGAPGGAATHGTRGSAHAHVVVALQAIPADRSLDQRDRALCDLYQALASTLDLDSEIEPVAPSTLVVIAPEHQATSLLTRVASIVEQLGHEGLGITGSATIGPVRRVPLMDDTLLTGSGAEQALASLPHAPDHGILLSAPAVRLLRRDAGGRRALREPALRPADDHDGIARPRTPSATRWVKGRIDGWDARDEHGTLKAEGRRHHFGSQHLHPGTPTPSASDACLADIVGGRLQAVLLIGQRVEVLVTNVKPGRFAFGDVLIGDVPRNLYLADQGATDHSATDRGATDQSATDHSAIDGATTDLAVGDVISVTIGTNPQGPVGLPG